MVSQRGSIAFRALAGGQVVPFNNARSSTRCALWDLAKTLCRGVSQGSPRNTMTPGGKGPPARRSNREGLGAWGTAALGTAIRLPASPNSERRVSMPQFSHGTER